jgi:hypothetical protein
MRINNKMTNNPNVFVTCTSGSNAFTDCLVRRAGENVELIGHSQMQFTKAEAKYLMQLIKDTIEEIEQSE